MQILRPEGHIVAKTLEHRLRVRILQYQSYPPDRLAHGNIVYEHMPFGRAAFGVDHNAILLAGVLPLIAIRAQQSGRALKNGGFANARSPQQQYALPGLDGKIQPSHAEIPAGGVAIPPVIEAQYGVRHDGVGCCD